MADYAEAAGAIPSVASSAYPQPAPFDLEPSADRAGGVRSSPGSGPETRLPNQDGSGEAIRRWLEAHRSQLRFERDEASGRIVARLKDPETGEVIRQIPPEEMLKLARAIDRYLGLLVDRQS